MFLITVTNTWNQCQSYKTIIFFFYSPGILNTLFERSSMCAALGPVLPTVATSLILRLENAPGWRPWCQGPRSIAFILYTYCRCTISHQHKCTYCHTSLLRPPRLNREIFNNLMHRHAQGLHFEKQTAHSFSARGRMERRRTAHYTPSKPPLWRLENQMLSWKMCPKRFSKFPKCSL